MDWLMLTFLMKKHFKSVSDKPALNPVPVVSL